MERIGIGEKEDILRKEGQIICYNDIEERAVIIRFKDKIATIKTVAGKEYDVNYDASTIAGDAFVYGDVMTQEEYDNFPECVVGNLSLLSAVEIIKEQRKQNKVKTNKTLATPWFWDKLPADGKRSYIAFESHRPHSERFIKLMSRQEPSKDVKEPYRFSTEEIVFLGKEDLTTFGHLYPDESCEYMRGMFKDAKNEKAYSCFFGGGNIRRKHKVNVFASDVRKM